MKRMTAFFSGRVQGIGFRFTTERLARPFNVKGFVRNLPNGKVELKAEGEEAELKEFLQSVREAMERFIQDVQVEWSEPEGEFKEFRIRT